MEDALRPECDFESLRLRKVGAGRKSPIKEIIRRTPVIGDIIGQTCGRFLSRGKKPEPFPGSAAYWENRYATGGDSGVGSYGFFAEYKAEALNDFVAAHNVRTVIEFGCGDGHQLGLAKYPSYLHFARNKPMRR